MNATATFASELETLPLEALSLAATTATRDDAERALQRATGGAGLDLHDLASLLSPAAGARLEDLAGLARRATERRFGHTVHLFAPLYLSNECLSTCTYCGFSKHLDVRRRTLTIPEVCREAAVLADRGFRHLLLVSAEHQQAVTPEYLVAAVAALRPLVPSITIETQVWDRDVYERLVGAGAEGVVIYQETYDPQRYAEVHVAGRKRRYGYRLEGPERAAAAGMRRLGIGALLGLHDDWRREVLAVAAHARWLQRRFWRTEVTVSLPRLRPSASGFQPRVAVTDREFVQATAALRLALPDAGIVLSTREPAALRDGIVRLGVTHMSAGSHTEPGGYAEPGEAEEQFAISDDRSAADVAAALRSGGFDPVWKDWSPALAGDALARL